MAENKFLLPLESYQRAISPVKDWLKQTALYASKMLDKPFDECLAHLEKKLRSKEIEFTNPTVVHYRREDNGDRFKQMTPLSSYIQESVKSNEVIAPTFTTYLPTSVKQSSIVKLLDTNVAKRKKYKKTSQQYEAEGNIAKYKYYNQLQDAAKRKNNACSGGMVADGSVIQNKSAHSTLTSTIRTAASLSNASNEKLIEGNRHYYTPQIALNNLIAIVTETDLPLIQEAVETFGLVYPSYQDVIECVNRSLGKYIRGNRALDDIRAFVYKLSPEERAAVVYTGDFYHLCKYNKVFIFSFIEELSQVGSTSPVDNPVALINNTDEQVVNYAHQINITMMAGKGKKYGEKLSYEEQCILANTCISIENTVEKYQLFIKAFFLSRNLPCTVATIMSMTREAVVLSDTDSTMYSVDHWVISYFGKLEFSDRAYAIAGAVAFMANQSIAHILAIFSANLGVERSRIFSLSMKPEFVFPVFAQTSSAKHYYTAKKVKEGNVYADIDMEIKGVHMKDSTVPSDIIESAADSMEEIIRTVMSGDQVSLDKYLNKLMGIEKGMINSLYTGESEYLRRFKIKESSSYKKDKDQSPYQYYTFWQSVFAKHYGDAPKPPYDAVRIPLDIPNMTAMKEWIDAMENREIAEGLAKWLLDNNKKMMKNVPIPFGICKSHGVPAELKQAMNVRNIVTTLTKSHRNVVESLGYYIKPNYLITEMLGEEIDV